LPDLKERFALGERVQLSVRVTDEDGQPAAAALVGVRAWNEALVGQLGQTPVVLEEAARDISSEPVGSMTSSVAVKYAYAAGQNTDEMATSLTRANVSGSTSNRAAVEARFEAAVAAAARQRQTMLRVIGGVVVTGGILLALLLGLLAILRMPSNLQVTIPAVVVVTASLLVGIAWVGWPPSDQQPIAMATVPAGNEAITDLALRDEGTSHPAPVTTVPAQSLAGGENLGEQGQDLSKQVKAVPMPAGPAGGTAAALGGIRGAPATSAESARSVRLADDAAARPGAEQVPASLYFNPHLITDADGRATIEFQMPPVASEYRLLIDALGKGRIGSRQQVIVGRAADGK